MPKVTQIGGVKERGAATNQLNARASADTYSKTGDRIVGALGEAAFKVGNSMLANAMKKDAAERAANEKNRLARLAKLGELNVRSAFNKRSADMVRFKTDQLKKTGRDGTILLEDTIAYANERDKLYTAGFSVEQRSDYAILVQPANNRDYNEVAKQETANTLAYDNDVHLATLDKLTLDGVYSKGNPEQMAEVYALSESEIRANGKERGLTKVQIDVAVKENIQHNNVSVYQSLSEDGDIRNGRGFYKYANKKYGSTAFGPKAAKYKQEQQDEDVRVKRDVKSARYSNGGINSLASVRKAIMNDTSLSSTDKHKVMNNVDESYKNGQHKAQLAVNHTATMEGAKIIADPFAYQRDVIGAGKQKRLGLIGGLMLVEKT